MPSPEDNQGTSGTKEPALDTSASAPGDELTLPVDPSEGVPISPAPLPERFGRYHVSARLGAGAFGEVFRGFDEELARQVAIKVPRRSRIASPEDLDEFKTEARMLAGLRHAAIVPVFDYGINYDGRCYFVTAFIDGPDLAHAIVARPFTFRETALLVATLAEALHYAHKQGLVHRDVKPANILLENGSQPLLADFGLALHELEQRQRAGEQSGTPAYMSPEQARGEAHRLDGRTDIWSLGVVLYELLTKRKPFAEESLSVLFDEIENRDPKPPRQINDAIPKELERICLKALAKRTVDRFTTAQDMADESRRTVEDWDATTRPIPSLDHASRSDFREPLSGDNVQFTVYRPKAVKPLAWQRLLAFAHLAELPADAPPGTPEPLEQVRQEASRQLGVEVRSFAQTTQDGSSGIPQDGELTFIPQMPGVEFNPRQRTFRWDGAVHREEFQFCAAKAISGTIARGRLNVFLGALLLAEVPLAVRIEESPAEDSSESEVAQSRRFRKVYAAYSRDDREVVTQFEHYAEALGDKYLSACTHLRGTDRWNERLLELIREADVFQLFWSRRSMHSLLVKQEWEHALSLARPDFIRPVYWEDPLPADPERQLPPPELQTTPFIRFRPAAKATLHHSLSRVRTSRSSADAEPEISNAALVGVYELIAQGPQPDQKWRQTLTPGKPVRLGRAPSDGWAVSWDHRLSREHCDLLLEGARLRVRCLDTALNPAHVQDQALREFTIGEGESFRIGASTFHLGLRVASLAAECDESAITASDAGRATDPSQTWSSLDVDAHCPEDEQSRQVEREAPLRAEEAQTKREAKEVKRSDAPSATFGGEPSSASGPKGDLQSLKDQLAAQAAAAKAKKRTASLPAAINSGEPGRKKLDLVALKAELEAKKSVRQQIEQSVTDESEMDRGSERSYTGTFSAPFDAGTARSDARPEKHKDRKFSDPTSLGGSPRSRLAGWGPTVGLGLVSFLFVGIVHVSTLFTSAPHGAGDADGWATLAGKLIWMAMLAIGLVVTGIGAVRSWGLVRIACGVGFAMFLALALGLILRLVAGH